MFGWLFTKKDSRTEFPDNETAFAHAGTLRYPLLVGALIPALVREKRGRGADGEEWYRLHLAGANGVLEITGCTMPGAPDRPEVGDLVAFRIVRIATDLPECASLIGYVACRLEPVLVGKKKWVIGASFTPANLKPELHL